MDDNCPAPGPRDLEQKGKIKMSVYSVIDLSHMPVYMPGVQDAPGSAEVIKLSSNESALGPSSRVLEAYRSVGRNMHRYPDPASTLLRNTLAECYRAEPEQIVCGVGSESLIRLILRTYAAPGDEVLYSQYAFSVFRIAAVSLGVIPLSVPERNYTADPEEMLNAVSERTRIVYLANPNNPTGTLAPYDSVLKLADGLPEHVLLVLDSAYAEYVQDPDYQDGRGLVREGRENVIVLGTFSKIYSLAGLRVGWSYSSREIADTLRKVMDVFGVSVAAQAAAVAALGDTDHSRRELEHVSKWQPWLYEKLTGMGFAVTPSVANFLLMDCDEMPLSGPDYIEALMKRGIIIRPVSNFGIPNGMRATVGTERENRALVGALSEIVSL
jgi:histidinol-phosphate aminotransferase